MLGLKGSKGHADATALSRLLRREVEAAMEVRANVLH